MLIVKKITDCMCNQTIKQIVLCSNKKKNVPKIDAVYSQIIVNTKGLWLLKK